MLPCLITMKRFLPALIYYFLITITCCTQKKEKGEQSGKDLQLKMTSSPKKPKFYGYPDLPKNDYEITSIGMGKIILGDSVQKVFRNYPNAEDTFFTKSEIKWRAAIIKPDSGSFIIAETEEAVGLITFIHTNCKAFITRDSIKVGMKVKDFAGDTLQAIELNNKTWIIIPGGNTLVRPASPLKLKTIQGKPKGILKEDKITEIGVYCGDC